LHDLLGVAGAAVGAFAGTNVDDILILAVLFAAGRPRAWEIWAGQYLGILTLIAISVVAALGLTLVPDRWVPLLGLIPITLGVRGLVRARDDDEPPAIAGSSFAVAAVTIANGADNIAVYTPMFRALGCEDVIVTIAVFLVMVAVWCVAARALGSHRHAAAVIERWGHWLVPAVFIAIGLVILFH